MRSRVELAHLTQAARDRLQRLSLLQRLLLVEAAVFAIVLFGTLFTTRVFAEDMRRSIERDRLHLTALLGDEVDQMLATGVEALRLVRDPAEVAISDQIPALRRTLFTRGLVVTDGAGVVTRTEVTSAGFLGANWREYMARADTAPGGVLGWGFKPGDAERQLMAIAVPIPGPSTIPQTAGYVVGLVDAQDSRIATALRSARRIGTTEHADLVDSHAIALASTEAGHLLRPGDHPEFFLQMLGAVTLSAGVRQVVEDEGPEEHIMGFVRLQTFPWGISMGGSAEETLAPVRRMWMYVLGLMFGLGTLALGVTLLGTRYLVRPVRGISDAARRVAAGDLDARIEVGAGGEIGELADSIDIMRGSLRAWGHELDARVRERTEELERRTAEVSVSASVARAASATLAIEPLVEDLAGTLQRDLGMDAVVIYARSDGGRKPLVRTAPHNLSLADGLSAACEACLVSATIGTVNEADPRAWRPLGAADFCLDHSGFRSALTLPLRSVDRMVGSVCFLRRSTQTPASLDVPFLSLLAAEVGMGLGNALLYEDLRWREEHRQQLLALVLSAQEEERRRLARELHDDTGQALTALILGLDGLADELAGRDGAERTELRLARLRLLSGEALSNLRKMVLALRPTALDDLGLVAALQRYADFTLQGSGIVVDMQSNLRGQRLARHDEIGVFRILQEAINNVSRHSRATRVHIRVNLEDSVLTAEVQDDGVGFRPRASDDPMVGVGIGGMHERAELLGGQLAVDSSPGQGTVVRLTVHLGFELGGNT